MTTRTSIQSVAKRYPRLTRSGLLIAFALSADQVSQTYATGE